VCVCVCVCLCVCVRACMCVCVCVCVCDIPLSASHVNRMKEELGNCVGTTRRLRHCLLYDTTQITSHRRLLYFHRPVYLFCLSLKLLDMFIKPRRSLCGVSFPLKSTYRCSLLQQSSSTQIGHFFLS